MSTLVHARVKGNGLINREKRKITEEQSYLYMELVKYAESLQDLVQATKAYC